MAPEMCDDGNARRNIKHKKNKGRRRTCCVNNTNRYHETKREGEGTASLGQADTYRGKGMIEIRGKGKRRGGGDDSFHLTMVRRRGGEWIGVRGVCVCVEDTHVWDPTYILET